jgi:hypothetical protein
VRDDPGNVLRLLAQVPLKQVRLRQHRVAKWFIFKPKITICKKFGGS